MYAHSCCGDGMDELRAVPSVKVTCFVKIKPVYGVK